MTNRPGLEPMPAHEPPKIGGTLPHDAYMKVLYSIAISLKRIADQMEHINNAGH